MTVDALLAIKPEESVTAPTVRAFGLSVSQTGRRIKAATRMAGLRQGVHCALAQGGHGPGPERIGSGVAGVHDRRRVGQPDHADQVHRSQAAGKGAVARYYRGEIRK